MVSLSFRENKKVRVLFSACFVFVLLGLSRPTACKALLRNQKSVHESVCSLHRRRKKSKWTTWTFGLDSWRTASAVCVCVLLRIQLLHKTHLFTMDIDALVKNSKERNAKRTPRSWLYGVCSVSNRNLYIAVHPAPRNPSQERPGTLYFQQRPSKTRPGTRRCARKGGWSSVNVNI